MTEDHVDSSSMDLIGVRAGRWLHVTAWVVALVVFEMTADPALVVLVGCSKFGWQHLRAARWLRKQDPIRTRGRACRWFYMSWGLWRISIVATLLMFVVAVLFAGLREALGAPAKGGNEPPSQFLVAILVAFFGFIFSTLTSFFGVVSAWRSRVRVWVGHAGIESFRSRSWPPMGQFDGRNRIGGLLLTAVPFAFVLGIFPFVFLGIVTAAETVRKVAGDRASAFTIILLMIGSIIGGVFALMSVMDAAKRRMEAASPEDCWRDQLGAPPSSNQIRFGRALR